jgi:spore germination protein KA
MDKINNEQNQNNLSHNLSANLETIKALFCFPTNQDIIFREIYLEFVQKESVLVYIDGIVDDNFIDRYILYPLQNKEPATGNKAEGIDDIKNIISSTKVNNIRTVKDLSQNLIEGNTILLIDGYNEAIAVGTIKYEKRNIERSETENVIKGPHEAFVESSKINRSLIRKQLKAEKLVTESITIGKDEVYRITFMYIRDLADTKLVSEVKRRVQQIQSDGLLTISILGSYIEEYSYSIVPTVLYTELPDRAAAFITEGHVVILMDNSPSCLIAPATFWSFFHTPEDMYQRWIAGNFIRLIRILAIFITILTPALYIAVTNFHQEMIPTDLLLAITSSREKVPFPIIFEVIGMEFVFELIREASIRIPASIGSTIGIVGALILGQAAVQANIISPLLVIIVSLTGVSSFAVSNVDLNLSIRILRFFFLLCGVLLGFLGIGVAGTAFVVYIVSLQSFGVPYFAPITPHYPSSKDMIFRSPSWKQRIRPLFTKLQKTIRIKPRKGE